MSLSKRERVAKSGAEYKLEQRRRAAAAGLCHTCCAVKVDREPIHVSEMFGRRFRTHRTTTTGKSDEERDGTRGFRAGIAW